MSGSPLIRRTISGTKPKLSGSGTKPADGFNQERKYQQAKDELLRKLNLNQSEKNESVGKVNDEIQKEMKESRDLKKQKA